MPISLNDVELSRLAHSYDSSVVVLPVFLKQVVAGKAINLYTYKDDIKLRYVIKEKTASTPEELTYQIYYDGQNDDKTKIAYGFRSQLLRCAFVYKNGDNNLISRIQNLNYNNDIIRVVYQLNDQKEDKKISPEGSSVRFMVGVAYDAASFNAVMSDPSAAGYNGAQNVSFPQFSIGIDGFLNPNTRRLISRLEISYLPYHTINISSNSSTVAPVTVRQQSFLISPQLLYNFYNSSQVKVFGGVGVNLSFNTTQNPNGSAYTAAEPNIRSYYTQVPFKAGVALAQKVEIYINYVLPVGLNYSNIDVINMSVYKAGINYLFGSK